MLAPRRLHSDDVPKMNCDTAGYMEDRYNEYIEGVPMDGDTAGGYKKDRYAKSPKKKVKEDSDDGFYSCDEGEEQHLLLMPSDEVIKMPNVEDGKQRLLAKTPLDEDDPPCFFKLFSENDEDSDEDVELINEVLKLEKAVERKRYRIRLKEAKAAHLMADRQLAMPSDEVEVFVDRLRRMLLKIEIQGGLN